MLKTMFAFIRLMRIDRPIGTLLLLWPTLWAVWIAGMGRPDASIALIFIAGVFVMRSAGCVINDYADRHWDKLVERTQDRPLTTQEITEKQALTLFVALLLLALLLVLQLNRTTIVLSLGAVAIASIYPFTKRFSNLPQLVLGIAFSWGIPMAFTAQEAPLWPIVVWLIAANVFWVVAYDTVYAVVDRPDDLKAGIKSTAILFGRYDRAIIFALHLASLACLLMIGKQLDLSWHYYLGLAFALANACGQQWLMRIYEPAPTFKAFLSNSWYGAFVFCGLVLSLL